jgi:Na+-driven multidrug efflux pump
MNNRIKKIVFVHLIYYSVLFAVCLYIYNPLYYLYGFHGYYVWIGTNVLILLLVWYIFWGRGMIKFKSTDKKCS